MVNTNDEHAAIHAFMHGVTLPHPLPRHLEEDKGDGLIRALAYDRKKWEWNMARGWVCFDTKAPLTTYMNLPDTLENWLDQELDSHFLIIRDAHLALRDAPLVTTRLKALVRKIIYDEDTTATIFLVSSQSCVPPELEKFITVFDQSPPEKEEISELIRNHANDYRYDIDEEVVGKLIVALRGLSEYEITRLLNRGYQRDGAIGADDIALVGDEKKQIVRKNGSLEMVSATGEMDTVGGLKELKEWLKDEAAIMKNLPAAQAAGVGIPQGAIIAGRSGCGKSLTAKAASALFGLPLLQLNIGALMGKYLGESEANMRRALRLAETVSPCVLWIDELDKALTGNGGGTGNAHEVTIRLLGDFLIWMQEKQEKTKPVFVLATANKVSHLPEELLRKGRFDGRFYVTLPNDDERAEILKVHLKKRKKDGPQIDMKRLVKETDGFSGADLEGVVKDAIKQVFLKVKGKGEAELKTAHLLKSIKENKPHAMLTKDEVDKEDREEFEKRGFRKASG